MSADRFMVRARELAERGRYTAAPNPLVGVVIVRGSEIVGEGWHARAGGAHAEVAALESCGDAARGATMYSTLEPCNHHGRTPPCTEAIIRAGISRVVTDHLDPDPRMRGRSLAILRSAGVETQLGGDGFFERQNEQFSHYMRTGRPFVHLKLASTLDGRIATRCGESKWITGAEARRRAHLLRAEAGAVLVGARTVRTDDPTLTARDVEESPPELTRVVIDPGLTVSEDARLPCSLSEGPIVVFASREAAGSERVRKMVEAGVEVVGAPVEEGEMEPGFILDELGRRGIRGVLVEGGGRTASGFLRRGLVQKVTMFYAPAMIGSDGIPAMGRLGVERILQAARFEVESVEHVGDDVAVTVYPKGGAEENVYRAG